jgi:hypothetical protein
VSFESEYISLGDSSCGGGSRRQLERCDRAACARDAPGAQLVSDGKDPPVANMCTEGAESISIPPPGSSPARPSRPRIRPNELFGISQRSQTTVPSDLRTRKNDTAAIAGHGDKHAGPTSAPSAGARNDEQIIELSTCRRLRLRPAAASGDVDA